MLVPLWSQRIQRLTIDFLKHPIHVLKVVMIQEPHIRIFFVLVKRNYQRKHRSDHCLLKGVKKLRKKQKSLVFFGKISAQPHTTLCIQFLDRENSDQNNILPLGKQICFTIVWGCAEILPFFDTCVSKLNDRSIRFNPADPGKTPRVCKDQVQPELSNFFIFS